MDEPAQANHFFGACSDARMDRGGDHESRRGLEFACSILPQR
jgi:hypothetical protein